MAILVSIFQGSGFSLFVLFSLSSLLSLWGGGGIFGGVIIEWVWRFAQHTFLVVILVYDVVDISSFHCLFFNAGFIEVQEAFVSFALLFVAID